MEIGPKVPAVRVAQKTIEIPQVQHIDEVVDFPSVQVVQTVQKIVEIPVEFPLMTQRQVPAQAVQKTVECAQVQLLDKIADVPVATQHQVPDIERAKRLEMEWGAKHMATIEGSRSVQGDRQKKNLANNVVSG